MKYWLISPAKCENTIFEFCWETGYGVEMSPYDLTRGRIVYRHKKQAGVPRPEV